MDSCPPTGFSMPGWCTICSLCCQSSWWPIRWDISPYIASCLEFPFTLTSSTLLRIVTPTSTPHLCYSHSLIYILKQGKCPELPIHMNAPSLVTNPTVTSQPILPTSNNSHPLFVPSRCKAKDRLILWTPVKLHAMSITDLLSPSDIKHVYKVIAQAWADSTKEIYDFKQLAFHIFCNNKNIPELNCAPANPVIICSFISTLVGPCMGSKQICYILILYFNFAGSYSDSMVSNYLNRVRTWHIIHGVKWALNDQKIKALLKAAFLMALPQSK